MSNNVIKIVACVSMLIDHIGLMFFDDVIVLRCIGRLAMPLFAYCIAQGCRYTHSRLKYFLRVFVIGALCQGFYAADMLLFGSTEDIFINIMLVFSISIILCCMFLDIKDAVVHKNHRSVISNSAKFLAVTVLVLVLDIMCKYSEQLLEIKCTIDYGIMGIFLPVFAVAFDDKIKSVTMFGIGLLIYCFTACNQMSFVWWCMLSLPILYLYNGKRGKLNIKYSFYLFYPLHLAVLYLISIL